MSLFVRQATAGDVVQFEPEIRRLAATYSDQNGYIDADSDVCVNLTHGVASNPKNGCVLFLLDGDFNLKGYLVGVLVNNPFNGEKMAAQVGIFVQKGSGGHAWKMFEKFELWAGMAGCRQIHAHISIPFDTERWDAVMARKGYKPVERVYCKEV